MLQMYKPNLKALVLVVSGKVFKNSIFKNLLSDLDVQTNRIV